jgi:hypothetical protein
MTTALVDSMLVGLLPIAVHAYQVRPWRGIMGLQEAWGV